MKERSVNPVHHSSLCFLIWHYLYKICDVFKTLPDTIHANCMTCIQEEADQTFKWNRPASSIDQNEAISASIILRLLDKWKQANERSTSLWFHHTFLIFHNNLWQIWFRNGMCNTTNTLMQWNLLFFIRLQNYIQNEINWSLHHFAIMSEF